MRFVVGHKPKRLLSRLSAGKIEGERPDLVVWGHTHTPSAAWIDGALYLNPGTASSPEDEDDGPTVAIVEVGGGRPCRDVRPADTPYRVSRLRNPANHNARRVDEC